MSQPSFAAVRGMNDLLPAESPLWERFETRVVDWLRSYGYRQMRTPLVEHTGVFARGIGAVTDIVEREMYSFEDRLNGEQLTLRPEFTAGIVRASIESHLVREAPRRIWSMGPVFRHEKPQRGRYRQFHQVDVEALGFAGPDIDAEQIIMLRRLWQILEIGPVRLEINSLGQPIERAAHRAALVDYLSRHADSLDDDSRRRLQSNPLRILDTKNPAMQALVDGAPRLIDHIGGESLAHFERLQELLGAAGLPFQINPRLVRGLDYYNLTVFEWVTDRLGAQGTICGGGRYDHLFELLGGKPTPACGFGMGIERVIELMRESMRDSGTDVDAAECDAYVLHQGGATLAAAMIAAERLRDAGLDVILHAGSGNLKAQMRRADASGAQFAVIVGEREAAAGVAAVKALRARDGADLADLAIPFAAQADVPLIALGEQVVAAIVQVSEASL